MLHHHVTSNSKPNIIIIITDQQRYDAVGYNNKNIITPNLDKLAQESIICNNAFVQSPQCQPSRASILTGRYPTAHRVWWNETKLSLNERTIANHLESAGYSTGYFGKLHIDSNLDYTSTARHFGFKHTFLSEDWQLMATGKLLQSGKPIPNKISEEFYKPMGTKTWVGKFTNRSLHHDDMITTKAVEFIQAQTKPYLAIISYNGPHPPYASPDEFSGLYDKSMLSVPKEKVPNLMGHILSDQEWRDLKQQYYGAVSWIDDNIKKITSIDNSAIIVFTSDHGDILGDHGLFSKGIFTYDGNIKVPLLFKIPGVNNKVYDHLVQSIDILPTVLNIAGIDIPYGIQGKSLLQHFRSNTPANHCVVSMLCHSDRLRMIRTNAWKYWIYGNNEYFYDLQNDPNENHNILAAPKLNAARFELLQALIRCEDPLPVPNSR